MENLRGIRWGICALYLLLWGILWNTKPGDPAMGFLIKLHGFGALMVWLSICAMAVFVILPGVPRKPKGKGK